MQLLDLTGDPTGRDRLRALAWLACGPNEGARRRGQPAHRAAAGARWGNSWLRTGVLVVLGLLVGEAPAAPASRVTVAVSFSVLADMVENVGQRRVEISTLVGPDQDAHVFSPTPGDIAKVANAGLLFVNGGGFEGWLERVVGAAAFTGRVVTVTEGIALLRFAPQPGGPPGPGPARALGSPDPHAWQHPALAAGYITSIANALARADPGGAAFYSANAAAYRALVAQTYAELRGRIARVDPGRRRIVVPHDGFQYLGAAFGLEIIAALPSAGEAEGSARRVAQLIRQVKTSKVSAIFTEKSVNPSLLRQIARETGVPLAGTLYADALSSRSGPAPTYVAMLRHNVLTIADALLTAPAVRP